MGVISTSMSKIASSKKHKNARDILNFLNTQGSYIRYINRSLTLFKALLLVPGTQQVNFFYGMVLGTSSIGQTSTIANKILALYGEGGLTIGPSQTLVLDAIVK